MNDFFQQLGKTPEVRERLNSNDRGSARLSQHFLKIMAGILSGPELVEFFSLEHARRTVSGEIRGCCPIAATVGTLLAALSRLASSRNSFVKTLLNCTRNRSQMSSGEEASWLSLVIVVGNPYSFFWLLMWFQNCLGFRFKRFCTLFRCCK